LGKERIWSGVSLKALILYYKIKRMTETEKEEEDGKNTDNYKDYIVADYTSVLDYKIA